MLLSPVGSLKFSLNPFPTAGFLTLVHLPPKQYKNLGSHWCQPPKLCRILVYLRLLLRHYFFNITTALYAVNDSLDIPSGFQVFQHSSSLSFLVHWIFLKIILYALGCAGPSLLWEGCSLVRVEAALCCSKQASHCGGFSRCEARALQHSGFSSCGPGALEHRLNSCGAWA